MIVTLLGSGNLATQLSTAMLAGGNYKFRQVYSPTGTHAEALAMLLGCDAVTDPAAVLPGSDLYIFALKDSAVETIAAQVPENSGIWVHTSGSLPMDIFSPYTQRFGVLYPLQTFSKERKADFSRIPFFIEASSEESMDAIAAIARGLSSDVRRMSSEDRRHLHLAAVFACNFVNHCYRLAGDILAGIGQPFSVLLPLIEETAAKVHELSPAEAQTGPAVRYDSNIIQKHLQMLQDPAMNEIYLALSRSIHSKSVKP